MNKILPIIFISIFMFGLVSATDYLPQKQNTNFELLISSNNATQCNWTYIQYPDGSQAYFNYPMTKSGTDFNYTINSGNFTRLGSTCMGITCYDGLTYETGSVCREVTPSGFIGTLGFYIILLIIIISMVLLGFSIKEEWFVILAGLGLMMLGIYSINYGVAGFRDMFMTWGIGLFEIGIGAILSIGSAVSKMED